jgi:hypothetical protein
MIWDRRSKILYPFACVAGNVFHRDATVNLYARNRRAAKRAAFIYFYRAAPDADLSDIKVYHMRDKPLAIPVKQNKGTN